ncbi:hypothetical protein MsAg5_07180 [Methanosarcinaceae archaeon Ag5]|uniref:PEGA domain-containing protein n=1 Tax=Methanolapillus africanus TaxID=3028297 RepID=A0AAE4SDK5_9EURY|nr:hypothetical protein [Methanosarcinaceae archaeon Ag5]
MKSLKKIASIFIVLLVMFVLSGAALAAPGSDEGNIRVNCNVDGAIVQLLNSSGSVLYTATIQNGYAVIPVYTTGTPVTEAVISADGYQTAVVSVNNPGPGQTTTISVTLAPTDSGDDYDGENIAFIEVDCNVNGALVQLVNANGMIVYTGSIQNGYAWFPIYIPATPITEVRASASGYYNNSTPVYTYPMDQGQVVTVNITLTPVSQPSSTSTYIVNCNVDGAKVSLIDTNGQVAYTGYITAGSVTINTDSNGATIGEIMVEANGYQTQTITITSSNRPAAGSSATFNVELTTGSSMSSTTWIWIALGIVVIIIAAAGVYYFYTTSKKSENK